METIVTRKKMATQKSRLELAHANELYFGEIKTQWKLRMDTLIEDWASSPNPHLVVGKYYFLCEDGPDMKDIFYKWLRAYFDKRKELSYSMNGLLCHEFTIMITLKE